MDTIEMAIEHYGITHQFAKFLVRLGKLQQVISRCLTASIAGEPDTEYHDHLAEEIADVEIMMTQIKAIYRNSEAIENWKEFKLERLFRRISEDGG